MSARRAWCKEYALTKTKNKTKGIEREREEGRISGRGLEVSEGMDLSLVFLVFQRKDGILMYHLALPEAGWYKLNIFADSQATRGPQLMCVFTYLFYVKTAKSIAYLMPKQFSDWTNECYLYSPLFLDSKCLSSVHFKVPTE